MLLVTYCWFGAWGLFLVVLGLVKSQKRPNTENRTNVKILAIVSERISDKSFTCNRILGIRVFYRVQKTKPVGGEEA